MLREPKEKEQKIKPRLALLAAETITNPAFIAFLSFVVGVLATKIKDGPLILKIILFLAGGLATWLLYGLFLVRAMIQANFVSYAGQKSDLEEM
jgi:hypothetical protein